MFSFNLPPFFSKLSKINPTVNNYRLVLINSLAVAFLLIIVRQLGWLQPLELKTFDLFVRVRGSQKLDKRLLLVTITEPDIQNLEEWPLSDRTVAKTLANLQQHRPAVIGLDIYRDFPQEPGYQELVNQLQKTNVIVIEKISSSETVGVNPPPSVPPDRVGFNDLLLDPDGVVRRQLMLAYPPDKTLYSFSLRVALKFLEKRGVQLKNNENSEEIIHLGRAGFIPLKSNDGGYVNIDNRGYQILLNYRCARNLARKVNLTEVLNGEIESSWVRDKIVLIGTTAASGKDLFFTPFSPALENPKMPGAIVQGQIVSQIISAALGEEKIDFPPLFWFWPEGVEIFWIGAWSIIGGIIAWQVRHPWKLGVIFTTANGFLLGICFGLFTLGGWVPLLPAFLGLLITGIGVIAEKQVYESLYDRLTGLPTRELLINRLVRRIKTGSSLEMPNNFALLFVDIDRFKVIENCFGNLTSDRLLISIAKRLKSCLSKNDTLAKIGIDEFPIVIHRVENIEAAIALASQIHQIINKPFKIGDREIFLTACIGIVFCEKDRSKATTIFRNAQVAVYRAKAMGPGNSQVFETVMHASAMEKLELETDLRRAITQEEFVLHYQPLISLKTGKINGFEALIRWRHPEKGMISPGKFIPVAEETGLIVTIGEWVLRTACHQLRVWQDKFQFDCPMMMSINLSGKQLSEPDLVGKVKECLEDCQLTANSVKLEITESVVMGDVERAIAILQTLKLLEVKLSIDDFGTGYSSLSYLHSFPTDTLKVDKSFVGRMEMEEEGTNIAIVKTIITLAHILGMDVIAEGIETKEQLEKLRSLGCEYGQGFFLSKPLPAEKAEALLESNPRYL